MKRIIILLLSLILAAFMVAATGCDTKNELVENSLRYNINTSEYSYADAIKGSFKIKVNEGIVTNVKFTVTGYDAKGKQLWSEDFNKYYKGLKPQSDPYAISFDYRYVYGSKRTSSVTLTEVKLIKENSNEWMGWTFGTVSTLATLAVIALFVVSKLKPKKEISSDNPET